MGELHYGTQAVFQVDDRVLAHLERVILAKLRRNEGFALALDDAKGGRDTMWLHAASAVRFHYDGELPPINRAWLEVLIDAANGAGGLRVLPEPT
ncbi:hypothetical protein BH11ACT3_BH11ACT3_18430 [soil metagenome]